jgi:saccharopine dehydrogenase-like NADP-dependent oxidoreductase
MIRPVADLNPTRTASVLILGAFGTFGARIINTLVQSTDLPIIAAGRRVPEVLAGVRHGVRTLAVDTLTLTAAALREINPAIVIDTVGPFQARDRKIARICMELGIHYIDLADGREFVQGVGALNPEALANDVLVISGASTVPALSCAVIDHLATAFSVVEKIEIGIAPGHLGPRGLATIRSVLGYVGRTIPTWRNGRMESARGWGDTKRHKYPPPVGARILSLIDVPDTGLFPPRYPSLRHLAIRAGYEVPLVHHALRLLGVLVRIGMIRDLASHANALQRMAALFDLFGSNNGSMHVQLCGRGADGSPATRTWTLIAEHGDGPQIPVTAAVLLTKKLLGVPGYSPLAMRGAMPAVGLLDLQEFVHEWRSLAIRTSVTDGAL